VELNHRMRVLAVVCAAFPFLLAACRGGSSHVHGSGTAATIGSVGSGYRSIKERSVGSARSCVVNGEVGPPSYSVYDIGKPGVPRPKTNDLHDLHEILKYVHPTTLRFAYLSGEFVVFDAYPDGLCSGGVPFDVLNGACSDVYAITDRPFSTVSAGECFSAPRPWVPHDRGPGKIPWSTKNSH
jgi:hypothetical protein